MCTMSAPTAVVDITLALWFTPCQMKTIRHSLFSAVPCIGWATNT